MMRLVKSIVAASFMGLISVPAASAELPQALGLVATATPIPMRCEGGVCRATLSAFCLQQDHRSPSPADEYRAVGAGTVRLAGRSVEGKEIELSALPLRFRAAPEYTAIEISFPEAALGPVQLTEVTVQVPAGASLVPVDAPKSAALANAVGPHREAAKQFFESSDTRGKSVDLANRLINQLPRTGRLAPADRQTVWEKVVQGGAKKDRAATEWMAEVYRNCSKAADASQRHTLRRCLSAWHHQSLSKTNKAFWAALAGV